MAPVLPDDYKMSIHVIAYKEERNNWHQWKIKTKVIGMKKKWVEALDKDYSFAGIVFLTDDDKLLKKKNSEAWDYLVMACDGKPFNIITAETESTNAYMAWTLLCEEYEPTTDEALMHIQEKFVTCCKKLMETEDPALWIDKLRVINKRLGGMDKKYQKGEIEMISYVFANLPKDYSGIVTVMKANGISSKSLNDLRRLTVRDKWEWLVEAKTKTHMKEESLNTSGNLGYCGKQGHKKGTCFKKKREEGGKGKYSTNNIEGEKRKVKNPNIICFHCKKKDHPAFMCPGKDKETGMNAFSFHIEEKMSKQN